MTSHGNDCYFFYYSTCTKGDSCPFRHCEAAMGNETICSLWQEGRCFRTVCKFRHMEITKNRKEIPCYWEKQPAGCQKPHCAFFHEKSRYVEGVLVLPDKSVKDNEQQHEEPVLPAVPLLPTTVNPQLRGVIKTETQEPVPSPTHPPVVINPVDDDEDEDDQFSEEGEEGKGGPPPRKLPKLDDSLNFGVSTLEEIRLRKALKASMKRGGYPIQTAETSTNGEKENIQTFFQPANFDSTDVSLVFEEPGRARVSVTERLGRKINNSDLRSAEGVPLKRSLAERLGRVMDMDQPSIPPQKALKSAKERLGLLCGPVAATQSAESSSQKIPEQIHIKTLEEIKQEKAVTESQKNAKGSNGKAKRAITVKDASIGNVKTFSETLRNKKKRQEEEQGTYPKVNRTWEKAPGKSKEELDTAGHGPEVTNMGEVRVKTLEEIRREKAARIQAKQAVEAEKRKSSDTEENIAKKPRLLAIKKLAPQSSISTEKSAEVTKKPQETPAVVPQTSNYIKVKTFEEIMREKQIRKQEMEEQAKAGATEEEHPQNQNAGGTLKRKVPSKISLTSPCSSSSPSSTTPAADYTQKVPVRKLVPLRSVAASPLNSVATPETIAVPSVPVKPRSSAQQARTKSHCSSRMVPDKKTLHSTTLSPVMQALVGAASTADETLDNDQQKSPENTADTKVRPKLNVKPSVMKPAVQVKPGQRRRGAEQSAVAAVKPLNSPSAVKEEPQQATSRDTQVCSSISVDAQLSSAVPCSLITQLGSGSSSSPSSEELQTVPVFKQSLGQESNPAISGAAAKESWMVPQSLVLKSPSQPKLRRPSTAASRTASTSGASTSTMDDFEELINEFTDDHLDDDVDPGIGEDDLLQELSEMIDS